MTIMTFAPADDRGHHRSWAKRLTRRLSALMYRAAERLIALQRDIGSDYYRFPPF
jgi:hypothetical protein